jgi:hypothetical protein
MDISASLVSIWLQSHVPVNYVAIIVELTVSTALISICIELRGFEPRVEDF